MQTFNLFPTTITVFDLQRKLSSEEMRAITDLLDDTVPNDGNKTSANKYVLRSDALLDLANFFTDSISHCLSDVFDEDTKLRITQSWLNRTDAGEFHHMHTHPNSYLSGVFYIKTNADDRIMFHKTDTRSSYYKPNYRNWNINNSPTWWLPASENTLYIFRSDVFHSVPPVQHDQRVSLSFNTFFSEDFGSESDATRLPL